MTFKRLLKLKKEYRLFMKPVWSDEILEGTSVSRCRASSFARILRSICISIGATLGWILIFLQNKGNSCFAHSWGRAIEDRDSLNTVRNRGASLSGPSDLPHCIPLIASIISSTKISFSSSGTRSGHIQTIKKFV